MSKPKHVLNHYTVTALRPEMPRGKLLQKKKAQDTKIFPIALFQIIKNWK